MQMQITASTALVTLMLPAFWMADTVYSKAASLIAADYERV